mgnify:FL=1
MTAPRLIAGLHGLGDNLMQRPFVRAMAKRVPLLFVQTPWPELYADLDAQWDRAMAVLSSGPCPRST